MHSNTEPPKRVTVSIKISPDIWKAAKRVALDREIQLSQLVENAILREISGVETRPAEGH
jgi:hypothetical protein